jgi:hypothetical protein
MSGWRVVQWLPSGRRAPCEWCTQMVEPGDPRTKLWHPSLAATGGKNGPGLWMHDPCSVEFLADNENEEEG